MSIILEEYRQNIWFLQTKLTPKIKMAVSPLVNEHIAFDKILKFIASNFCNYADIIRKYDHYVKTLVHGQIQILTRHDIEHLRGHPLSVCAPLALEYRGNPLVLTKKLVGIVGSRHPTFYGRLQAQKFARELSKLGYGIISGGAIGVDTIANSNALENFDGASISVIGSGISKPYPGSNYGLFKMLANSKHGLLLSEFCSNESAKKWYFPQRNSTIAELCDFLLVIEATQTSGSLMTAKFAKNCGKYVGALPGNIDNPNTAGSHMLIQSGALCIHQPEDVSQFFK